MHGDVTARALRRALPEGPPDESRDVKPTRHFDHDVELEPQQIGILVEKAYRGDKLAFAELKRWAGPSAIAGWFKAFEAQQAKRDLMSKLDKLRRVDELLGRSAVAVGPARGGRV